MTTRPNKPVSSALPRSLEDKVSFLRQENDYLRKHLEQHGITTQPTIANASPETVGDEPCKRYSVKEKITLFRNLFHGRTDVYPVCWENKGDSSKSGYIDSNHAQLMRMWQKRLTVYKTMWYRVIENDLFRA
mgnify:CR=1 FL=1